MNEDLREELIAIADEYRDGIFNRPKMEAAITAALSAVAPPPALEGWVLVPREPTGAMIEAAESADAKQQASLLSGRCSVGDIYRTMLAASPAAPAQPEGGEAVVWITPQQLDDLRGGKPWTAGAIGQFSQREREDYTVALYTRPAPAQQAVTDEMRELLHSTHEIALRGGADTNWEALAKCIAKLGIGPITARHYFAEGTSREAKDKHLDALLSRVNAARRAALTSTAAKAAEGAE